MDIGSLLGFGGGAKNALSGSRKTLRIPSSRKFKEKLSGKYLKSKVGNVKFGDKEMQGIELQEKLAELSIGASESTFKERMRKAGILDKKRNKILNAVREKFVLTNNQNARPSRDEQARIKKEEEKLKQRNVRRMKAFGSADLKNKIQGGGWYNIPKEAAGFAGRGANSEAPRGLAPSSDKNDSLGIGINKNNSLDINTGERPKFGGINN